MAFTVVHTDEQRTVVKISGSLDMVAVSKIEPELTRHVAMHRKSTVVDLSEVDFLASLGMGMFVANAQALRRQGARLVLLDPKPLVEEALRRARIGELIPIARGPAQLETLLEG
jgi:anti-anti-sigma factor